MKKFRFTKVIALALAMVMLLSVTAFADSHDYHFDFEQMTLNLAPGDFYKDFRVYIQDDYNAHYSVYVMGKTSKETYVWGDFKTGYSKLDIHIGADETASRVTLYFYIDESDTWDCVDINIVDPSISAIPATRQKAYQASKAGQPAKTAVPATAKVMSDGGLFDAKFYAESNPDVVKELGDKEARLYQHYNEFGKAEGRLPYKGAPKAK